MNFEYLDITTVQYGYAVSTICDTYKLNPDSLCAFRFSSIAMNAMVDGPFIRHTRRLPMLLHLPDQCNPVSKKGFNGIALDFYPLPDHSEYERTNIGLHEFRIFDPDQIHLPIQERESVRFWKWNAECDEMFAFALLCEKSQLRIFYRYLIKLSRHISKEVLPPILAKGMLNEIYENSIGFLLKGKDEQDKYRRYDIPYKRGLLLCGKPGTGKTLSCKWLRLLSQQHGFKHKIITLEDYEGAKTHGHMRSLFSMPKDHPGIIFFDDMDVMVKDRNQSGHHDLMNFLTHLDGINPQEGVVYVFTTNFLKELDEAFVRPGRIDLFLTFRLPGVRLRRQFVEQRFHEDIKQHICIEDIVERTKDYSFAEIEEVRKLLAIDLINERSISVESTFSLFEKHRKDFADRENFGFGRLGSGEDDPDDEVYPEPCGCPIGYPVVIPFEPPPF